MADAAAAQGAEWGLDRRLRYLQLARALERVGSAGPVLEVGAGPGNLTEWGWPAPVVAVDLSAHRRLDVRADAAHLPFRDGAFPITACVDVLEHIPADLRSAVLRELVRVTSATLAVGCPMGERARRTDAKVAAGLAGRGVEAPEWLDEHLALGPYPTAEAITAAVGRPPVVSDPGIAGWLHGAIVRAQTRRGGWWATGALVRRFPALVERLGALGAPYRNLAVYDLAERPAFSVVMATRNRSAVLPAAIASVLFQDEADLELVVVDDASTDDTAEVLRRVCAEDPRVRVVRSERASGSCARARNRGVAVARGAYLAFLDDDNVWRPDHLRRCRAALETAGACMTSVQRHLPDGSPFDVVALRDAADPSVGEVDANGLAVRAADMVPFPDGQGRYHSEDIRLVHELRNRGVTIVGLPDITVDYHFNEASHCYSYEISDGPGGPQVIGVPRVDSWRGAYGRLAEAITARARRARRRVGLGSR